SVSTRVDASRLLPTTRLTVSLLNGSILTTMADQLVMQLITPMPSNLKPPFLTLNVSLVTRLGSRSPKEYEALALQGHREEFGTHICVQHKSGNKDFNPEEISTMVLTKMKGAAESYLGHIVTCPLITVPAYFDDAQHQGTKDTGTIAALNVLCIVKDPTAAVITYGLDKKSGEPHIIVHDLEGGTFDVSPLSIDDSVFE
ncbi:15421_t:CDS:1, partial [Acaulospora colombiana]